MEEKHLQCIHILLNTALCLGSVLDGAWNLILSTAQQVCSVLDIEETIALSQGQRAKQVRHGSALGVNIAIAASSMSELPALGALLNQLFEASGHTSDKSLVTLMKALCKLSEETLDQIQQTQSVTSAIYRNDAHLFPVKKIWQTSVANLHRIMLFWPMVGARIGPSWAVVWPV